VKSRSTQLFEWLPEGFPDALLIVDAQGKILQANARAAALFGFGERQLNGQSLQAIFPGQPLTFSGESCGQREQAGGYLELAGRRSDSSQFPAVVTVMPLETANGAAALISIKDLAEVQQTQFILRRGLDLLMAESRNRQDLLRRLIQTREEERARIAADIHDDTIQTMAAASLRLQQLRFRLRRRDRGVQEILDKLEEALGLSLSRLRQLIFDLRPPGLDEGSLGAAVRVVLEHMHSDTGLAYRLDDRVSPRTPDGTTLLIYRNIREALTNVRKHAQAGTVTVELAQIEDGCLVRIADNGVGYDPVDVEDRPGHLGLVLIRERAELAGGWCRIESSPGTGTIVEFWVPFEESSTEQGVGHEHAE
jgi:PAS domain S-box-containing protein